MPSDLLLALGKMNLAVAAAILAVIVLRRPLRVMFGARLGYLLWSIVPLAAFAVLIPPRTLTLTLTGGAADAAAGSAPPAVAVPGILTMIDPWLVVAAFWIAGAVAMAAWLTRNQLRFLADARLGKAGPAVVGVLRPRIVTPSDFETVFSPRERAVILEHETAHLARRDAVTNGFVALAQCLCWFNPLVHVGARLMRIDQEMACDAHVIEKHPDARRTYAEAMVKAELAGHALPVGCHWPRAADHPLTERIAMLKHKMPGHTRRRTGALALIVLASGAGIGAWAAQPERIEIVQPAPQDRPTPQEVLAVPQQREVLNPRLIGRDAKGQDYTLTAQSAWRSSKFGVIQLTKPVVVLSDATISAESGYIDENLRVIVLRDGVRKRANGETLIFLQLPIILENSRCPADC